MESGFLALFEEMAARYRITLMALSRSNATIAARKANTLRVTDAQMLNILESLLTGVDETKVLLKEQLPLNNYLQYLNTESEIMMATTPQEKVGEGQKAAEVDPKKQPAVTVPKLNLKSDDEAPTASPAADPDLTAEKTNEASVTE